MSVIAHTFWLPRRGNSPAEYEDAWASNAASGRYAVADGASEGCFTGLWARLLVEDFVARVDPGLESWPTSLSAFQSQWDADVRGRNLPYHAEPWVRRGAFAAFLGIVLSDHARPVGNALRGVPYGAESAPSRNATEGVPYSRDTCPSIVQENSPLPPAAHDRMGEGQGVRAYHWQAIAVGDTCLFHTRGAALLRAFPLDDSQQFSNAPKLVGARTPAEEVLNRCLVWPDGRGQPGDRLWLMTDALAQWCLAAHEAGGNPWAELDTLLPSPARGRGAATKSPGEGMLPSPACGSGAGGEGSVFADWIEGLRSTRGLRNDDVTLLAIVLEESVRS